MIKYKCYNYYYQNVILLKLLIYNLVNLINLDKPNPKYLVPISPI